MVDVELDLPLGLLTRIDDDQVQVAVRPSSALGPRPEKDDLLGMDRFGDDLHHTLDHWIGDHAWPPVLKMSAGAGASKAASPRALPHPTPDGRQSTDWCWAHLFQSDRERIAGRHPGRRRAAGTFHGSARRERGT